MGIVWILCSFSIVILYIFCKVRAALGLDRCRHLATGAAPITMETLRYFQSLNMCLYELYGMSECSGPATIGVPWRNRTGSCGVSINGLTLKIHEPDEDGNGEVQYSILYDILCNSYTCKFCAKLKKNGCKHILIKSLKNINTLYGWMVMFN